VVASTVVRSWQRRLLLALLLARSARNTPYLMVASCPGNCGRDTGCVTEEAELARPGRLVWQTDNNGAVTDLAGHFWAMVSQGEQAGQVVWSWMIIGYENQVLAAGQTGDLAVAKLLVEEWNRWVCGPDATLDSTDNPSSIADECTTYQPVWASWPGRS